MILKNLILIIIMTLLAIIILWGSYYFIKDTNITKNHESLINNELSSISKISERDCQDDKCQRLRINCNNLPVRIADIRYNQPSNPKGTIILTTGGDGMDFYGDKKTEKQPNPYIETISILRDEGYQIFEVRWPNDHGWAFNNSGEGYKKVMCAYSEVTNYINNLAVNNDVMCATGNSGGSFQIGYGLTLYNLEEIYDFVLLSGGPPTGDVVDICKKGNAPQIMDWVMDYPDYCKTGNVPDSELENLERESLVSSVPGELRDLNYPNTIVSFVQGERDKANYLRGEKYYNAITSEKLWKILPKVGHGVQNGGADEIRTQLLKYCK